jgi:hypothetical protein
MNPPQTEVLHRALQRRDTEREQLGLVREGFEETVLRQASVTVCFAAAAADG